MHKLRCVWFLLSLFCCALGQKKYVVQRQSGYDVHSNEEDSHYESNHYEYQHKPFPYRFGYDIKDEKGNTQYHKEEGDEYNVKKGSYGFVDAHGIYRHVDYIADHMGFRAKIRTNEPGTANYHPAHVSIHAEPPPSHIYANYDKYQQPDYQQPDYQQPDYQQPDYQQPEHAKYQHSDYQQQEHENYDSSPHQEYEKTTQSSYDEPEHNVLVKPVNGQNHQNDHGDNYPKLDHQKYTYVPVYVSNNIDYKN